jgi:hypothetical protein
LKTCPRFCPVSLSLYMLHDFKWSMLNLFYTSPMTQSLPHLLKGSLIDRVEIAALGCVENRLSMGCLKSYNMDKLELTGQNLGRVFNSRRGRTCVCHAIAVSIKQPSLKLKTGSKLLFGSLPINTSFARNAWMLLPCRPIDVISSPSTKDLHGETLCSTSTLNNQSICSTQDNSKPDPVEHRCRAMFVER